MSNNIEYHFSWYDDDGNETLRDSYQQSAQFSKDVCLEYVNGKIGKFWEGVSKVVYWTSFTDDQLYPGQGEVHKDIFEITKDNTGTIRIAVWEDA